MFKYKVYYNNEFRVKLRAVSLKDAINKAFSMGGGTKGGINFKLFTAEKAL